MNYDSLTVPEAFSAIAPADLVKNTLRSLKLLTGKANALSEITLAKTPMRSGYQTWEVPINSIRHRLNANTGDTEYLIDAGTRRADAVNVMSDAQSIGLVGRDFYYEGDECVFKKDPTKFGTISANNRELVLTFSCIGSVLQSMLEPTAIAFRQSADEAARAAINEALYESAPMGLTPNLIVADCGCHLSLDPLTTVWSEGSYTLGVTEHGDLVYAPTSLGLNFLPGLPVDFSKLLLLNNIDNWNNAEIFCVKLPSGVALVFPGWNDVNDYKGVLETYPELHVVDGKFSGMELIVLLKNKGCVFYRWNYIKDNGEVQKVLSNYTTAAGKVVIDVVARGADDLSGLSLNPSPAPVAPIDSFTDSALAYNFI